MRPVNLYDRLDDPLFYPLHAIQLFVKDPAGLLGINGFKIISLPLDIHHNGKGALGMAALLR